jgi:hypothetical protein
MYTGGWTRIVFLDIDGVLNSHAFFARRADDPEKEKYVDRIDDEAVARLQRLCAMNDANVVVSSTVRFNKTRVELQELLAAHGFKRMVLDKTPDYTRRPTPGGLWLAQERRGHEIQGWLDENERLGRFNVTGFVILDDDSDMAHLKSRLVKTSFDQGLTDADVERAAEVLRMPWAHERSADVG